MSCATIYLSLFFRLSKFSNEQICRSFYSHRVNVARQNRDAAVLDQHHKFHFDTRNPLHSTEVIIEMKWNSENLHRWWRWATYIYTVASRQICLLRKWKRNSPSSLLTIIRADLSVYSHVRCLAIERIGIPWEKSREIGRNCFDLSTSSSMNSK